MGNASLVTISGQMALENIASRFQSVFPNIFPQSYSPNLFHFRHTDTPRTNASIRAFARGLFGAAGAESVVYEDVPANDWFLRPFDFCPAFNDEVADWSNQQQAFREGPEIQAMIQQVNRKLGFSSGNQLNFDQIFSMWNWCRFKIAAILKYLNLKQELTARGV